MFSPLQSSKILDVKSFHRAFNEYIPIMDLFEKRFIYSNLNKHIDPNWATQTDILFDRNDCRTGQFVKLACFGNTVNQGQPISLITFIFDLFKECASKCINLPTKLFNYKH